MAKRILIVDDEPPARFALADLLANHPEVEVVGEADSVATAAQVVDQCQPDIIFLDIELPDGSGFDLLERVETRARVIFLTAFGEHALRAFEVNALDYLLKPADPDRLAQALARIDGVTGGAVAEPTGSEGDSLPRFSQNDLVCLQESKSLKFCRVSQIAFIQAADYVTEVHLASSKVALVPQSLRRWEERLPDSFVRVHRSTLVNLERVDEVEQTESGWFVHLRDRPDPLPISRRFAQALKSRLADAVVGPAS